MKVSDLYKQVAGLGFESSLDDDSRFYYAANRALLQVARIRPVTRACHINHKPLKNALLNSSFDSTEKSDIIFEAEHAKAYYFEADGNGLAYIKFFDGSKWGIAEVIELNSLLAFKAYYGFIKNGNDFVNGKVRITFDGDYLYHVRRVALYENVYSPNEKDIPAFEPYSRYDISEIAPDYLALASPPIVDGQMREVLSQNYDIANENTILLSHALPGEYIVRYVKRPTPIIVNTDAKNDQQQIDLEDDLCAILPNLIASYVYAEDEPQLAEYYLALYNQQAAVIEQKTRSYAPARIITNGW